MNDETPALPVAPDDSGRPDVEAEAAPVAFPCPAADLIALEAEELYEERAE